MAGELMRSGQPKRQIRNTLLAAGTVSLLAGLLAGATVCPIVKSIWTPSWVLFSGGICLLILTALYQLCEVREIRAWATPFVIVGSNAILLYTLAAYHRWRFALLPQKLTGVDFYTGDYGPVYEALVVGALLWLVAFALRRAGIFFKI
jgi:predicted acyltransferase